MLRWYAHNRGYDGNALWAGDALDETDADDEDTQKVKAARALMEKYGKSTMAETVCADLQLEPFGGKRASRRHFKGNNAAFPRETVRDEVRRILSAHAGVLPKVDDALAATLLDDVPADLCAALRLPARFSAKGGLLFGQYVPRFDNRIIGSCRITGKNVPLKNCREYLLYRWGRLLNNLTVFARDGSIRTLSANKPDGRPSEREKLDAEIKLCVCSILPKEHLESRQSREMRSRRSDVAFLRKERREILSAASFLIRRFHRLFLLENKKLTR